MPIEITKKGRHQKIIGDAEVEPFLATLKGYKRVYEVCKARMQEAMRFTPTTKAKINLETQTLFDIEVDDENRTVRMRYREWM